MDALRTPAAVAVTVEAPPIALAAAVTLTRPLGPVVAGGPVRVT